MDGLDSVELTTDKDGRDQSARLTDLNQMALAMAHDVNNALSIVLGRSQLALEENVDDRVRKHLQIIEEAVIDATARVRRFQDSATLTPNRTSEGLEFREEPVGAILGAGVNLLRHKGKRAGLTKHAAILVVDDDPDVIDVVGLMLQRLGYDVTEADNGHTAIEVFAERRHDLVICDVGMPEMSGYDVAKAIKAISPETRVILISGWALQLEQKKLPYVDKLIAKPLSRDSLTRNIDELTRLRSP